MLKRILEDLLSVERVWNNGLPADKVLQKEKVEELVSYSSADVASLRFISDSKPWKVHPEYTNPIYFYILEPKRKKQIKEIRVLEPVSKEEGVRLPLLVFKKRGLLWGWAAVDREPTTEELIKISNYVDRIYF